MATVLMVESWMNSTGRCLPPLIRELGHRYVLLTRDRDLYPVSPDGEEHPVIAHADEIVQVDTNDHDATVRAALELARRRQIDGVLTTCDYYVELTAVVADALGLPGAPPTVMHRATRKHLVRAALAEAGLPNPAFAAVSTWEAAVAAARSLGFPLVAKPVDLNSGTSVQRVDDEASLKDAFWEITGPDRNTRDQPLARMMLLEELVDGPEFSVEAVTRDGLTTVLGITDKSLAGPPAFVESGHMFPADLPTDTAETVRDYVRKALDAIGYTHGLSHTEVRISAEGPRIIEINPRQAGGYIFDLVHLVTGTHPLRLLVETALGNELPPACGGQTPASAAIFFVMSPQDGTVERVDGIEALDADPRVHRWVLPTPAVARRPRSNAAYLGHVLTVDQDGLGARAYAEEVVGSLLLRFTDGESATPVGVRSRGPWSPRPAPERSTSR